MTGIQKKLCFVLPGSIDRLTGGTIYGKRLLAGLRDLGWQIDLIELSDRFPQPSPADLDNARSMLQSVSGLVMVDGLALGAMPKIAAELSERSTLIGLLHHPLCLEHGLAPSRAAWLEASERAALANVQHVIVTSPTTQREISGLFDLSDERISVAQPGTDPLPVSINSDPFQIIKLGSLTQRKNHRELLDALAGITDLPWCLSIIGSAAHDPGHARALKAAVRDLGLDDRVGFAGELNQASLAQALHRADLLVSSSLYEGFGMALTEGLAAGLPVVAVKGGAVEQTVPGDAGILVEPGDRMGLEAALRSMVGRTEQYERKRQGALCARAALASWQDTAITVDGILTRLMANG